MVKKILVSVWLLSLGSLAYGEASEMKGGYTDVREQDTSNIDSGQF